MLGRITCFAQLAEVIKGRHHNLSRHVIVDRALSTGPGAPWQGCGAIHWPMTPKMLLSVRFRMAFNKGPMSPPCSMQL